MTVQSIFARIGAGSDFSGPWFSSVYGGLISLRESLQYYYHYVDQIWWASGILDYNLLVQF